MTDKLITTSDAANLLGVSSSRVRQFILDKRLDSVKIGRDQLLKQSDVEAFSSKPRPRTGRPKTIKS
jgi:excisionase family DNA binding protein